MVENVPYARTRHLAMKSGPSNAKVHSVKTVAKHKAKALSASQILRVLRVKPAQVKAVQSSLNRMGLIKKPVSKAGAHPRAKR
jgi:hypothetical protein